MGSYLHIQAGRYHLLLDTQAIHEIMDHGVEDDAAGAAGHRLWRNRALAAISCRRLLGEAPGGSGATVVYSPDRGAEPVLLDADRVFGLWHVGDDEWIAPPPLPEAVERLFDGLCTDRRTGLQLYRVRRGWMERGD